MHSECYLITILQICCPPPQLMFAQKRHRTVEQSKSKINKQPLPWKRRFEKETVREFYCHVVGQENSWEYTRKLRRKKNSTHNESTQNQHTREHLYKYGWTGNTCEHGHKIRASMYRKYVRARTGNRGKHGHEIHASTDTKYVQTRTRNTCKHRHEIRASTDTTYV